MSAVAAHTIVCPDCGTLNRVPAARLAERPRCGSCRAALLPAAPLAVDGERLERLLGHETLPLLCDFWAPWCAPCLSFAPTFVAAAEALVPRLRLAKLDTEAEPVAATRHRISAIPTLALFVAGAERARTSGALSLPALQRWVAAKLAA